LAVTCSSPTRNSTVTELNVATGALVRVIVNDGLDNPAAITTVGSDPPGDSVAELNAATGGLVQVISGAGYQFDDPTSITAVGNELFVADADGHSVTALSA
jgi:hypothetical protein